MVARKDRRALSCEFRFVVRCCRWPLDDAALAAIRHAADGIDWDRVAAIVRRHRVDALVHRALDRAGIAVPEPVAADLARSARRVSLMALRLAGETHRLVRLCEDEGIPVVVLKGAALASLAYGDLAIKHAVDIDLAVAPADLPAARGVLRAAGYEAEAIVVAKDEPWHHPVRDTRVELHAGLVEHDGWLAGIGVDGATQRVSLGAAGTVPTLGDEALFAYLCVHGATHGWSRLKWLADLAAYLAGRTPDELAQLAESADRLGAGRPAAQALLLCADLFGTSLTSRHARRLHASPINRWLVANALRSFTGRNETVELDAQPLGTVRIHLAQFAFSASWGDRRRLLTGKLRPGSPPGGAGLAERRSVIGWLRRRLRRSSSLTRPER